MADVSDEFFRAVIYYSVRNTILGHESQCSWPRIYHFLGPFAKLRRRLLCSSYMSVRPSTCPYETTRLALYGFS